MVLPRGVKYRAVVSLRPLPSFRSRKVWTAFGYFVRVAVPYVAGHYRINESQLYVSRGTGFWGPPMRLFAPAEISELVIRGPAHTS